MQATCTDVRQSFFFGDLRPHKTRRFHALGQKGRHTMEQTLDHDVTQVPLLMVIHERASYIIASLSDKDPTSSRPLRSSSRSLTTFTTLY